MSEATAKSRIEITMRLAAAIKQSSMKLIPPQGSSDFGMRRSLTATPVPAFEVRYAASGTARARGDA